MDKVITLENVVTVILEKGELALGERNFEAARESYDRAYRLCYQPGAEVPEHIHNRLAELETALFYR